MAGDWITEKLRQAEYHLAKIRAGEDELEVTASFAAFVACVRSTVMYVQRWTVTTHRVANAKAFWPCFERWLGGQVIDDVQWWRVLTSLRNVDMHGQPIDPEMVTEPVVRAVRWRSRVFRQRPEGLLV